MALNFPPRVRAYHAAMALDPDADDVLKKFAKMVSSDSKFLPTGTYDEYIEALEKKKMKDGTRKAINVCLRRSFKLYSVRKHSGVLL